MSGDWLAKKHKGMKKNYFQVLRLSVLMVLLLSFANTIEAQTFVCTDVYVYDSDKTDRDIQKIKKDALGSTCVLDFYDNSVKVTMTDNDGKSESLVLDKVDDSTYQIKEQHGRLKGVPQYRTGVIKLQKWVAYIKSFTISIYDNDNLEIKVTFKRK